MVVVLAHCHYADAARRRQRLGGHHIAGVGQEHALQPEFEGRRVERGSEFAGVGLLARDWLPGLTARSYDPAFKPYAQKLGLTMGMGMTEKQGSSDVRANLTSASADGEDAWGRRFRLVGHKWFLSAPMCDAFLVLAQAEGGLSCFFVPRIVLDLADPQGPGRANAIQIQRLSDKLGNQANASAEVEFHGATAWLIGEEGRGIPQILEMGSITRMECGPTAAGCCAKRSASHAITAASAAPLANR